MKKTTMQTLVDFLANYDEMTQIRDELMRELERNKDKANANRELYSTALEIVLANIEDNTAYSASAMYEYVEDKLPENFTKSKLQYALNNYWTEYFEKSTDKPDGYYTYTKKTA